MRTLLVFLLHTVERTQLARVMLATESYRSNGLDEDDSKMEKIFK